MGGKHVHLVDQVHLEAAPAGCVLHVFQQFAGVLDLGAGGGIHFDQIHEPAVVDFPAGGAFAAGCGGNAGFAIQRLGENPGDSGLAHAAGAGKQEGMVQPLLVERVGQGADHMLLADQFMEGAGPPFAGQNLIAHAATRQGGKAWPS